MEFLSLEPPEPRRRRELTGVEAQFASLVLHLLAALLILYLPRHLPESVRAFFRPSPPPLPAVPVPVASETTAPPKPAPRIPLQFAYADPSLRVPDDMPVKENPNARILSNRNRIARQEVPTPPEAKRFSSDPHSQGDSLRRTRPDPSRPEGPESVEPQPAERPEPVEAAGTDESARAAPPGSLAEGGGPGTEVVEGVGGPALRPAVRAGNGFPDAEPHGVEGPPVDSQQRVREMLQDVRSGEPKDTFYNPSYLSDGAIGLMSFDTKEFPWGNYGRQVYVKIENNWGERLPLAFREGLRGYVCVRFVWRKDGTITGVEIIRPSSVPPFNKAVLDALRASSPLPPLPENFPKDSEGATYCFFYNLLPQEIEEAIGR